ncbi:MAG: hypothetical protein JNM84_23630 [Planctomycetes bacterium]|nr:hypothetical protein [Planctomycetota bacterium]
MSSIRRSLFAFCLAAPLGAPWLAAQTPSPAAKPAPAPEEPIELGNEGPAGKAPVTREKLSTLVDVLLANDERVRGVVKNGRYVEVPRGIDFEPGERESSDAGIRVWHVAGTTSFAFIPYREIRSYRVVRTLSEVQVREFASAAREEARRRADAAREEAMRKLAQRKMEEQNAEVLGKLDDLAAKERAGQERIARDLGYVEILQRFSPEQGWSPTKLVDIRRRVALDLFPTEEEKAFILAYDSWRPAYVWWTQEGQARYETLARAAKDLALEQATVGEKPTEGSVVPTVPPTKDAAKPDATKNGAAEGAPARKSGAAGEPAKGEAPRAEPAPQTTGPRKA